MKSTLTITLVAIFLAGCSYGNSGASAATAAEANPDLNGISEDEEHRLCAAALASSESPLDTELFIDVCRLTLGSTQRKSATLPLGCFSASAPGSSPLLASFAL